MLGIRTWYCRLVGSDESAELWLPPLLNALINQVAQCDFEIGFSHTNAKNILFCIYCNFGVFVYRKGRFVFLAHPPATAAARCIIIIVFKDLLQKKLNQKRPKIVESRSPPTWCISDCFLALAKPSLLHIFVTFRGFEVLNNHLLIKKLVGDSTLFFKVPHGLYWGHQCSWTITQAYSRQVPVMQSDNYNRK